MNLGRASRKSRLDVLCRTANTTIKKVRYAVTPIQKRENTKKVQYP